MLVCELEVKDMNGSYVSARLFSQSRNDIDYSNMLEFLQN